MGVNIPAGRGYSSDSLQIAPEACFNISSTKISGQQAYAQLGTAMSFSEMQSELKIDVSSKGGVGMFSAGAEATYMRSMEQKDYSLSLNYYTYSSEKVSVNIAGFGQEALTSTGQSFYQDGKNPYFGLICGDNYIDSYEQGGMLIMGINVEFASHAEKEQFSVGASGSFGDIFSAAATISKVASEYNLKGSVSMQAYQIGGNPAEISNILKESSDGDYYALSCNLNAISDCQDAASGMLSYAKYNFTDQISYPHNQGLAPFGVGNVEYLPIEYIGLTTPSLVNQTILDDRITLADSLVENRYYVQKFHELVDTYPVSWNLTSNFYQKSQVLYKQAQHNVDSIMSSSNPERGALGCFDTPTECHIITKNIMQTLQPISQSDLNYLERVKHYYAEPGGSGVLLYPNGDDGDWATINTNPSSCTAQGFTYCTITPDYYAINYGVYCSDLGDTRWYHYNGTSTNNGETYQGTLYYDAGGWSISETMTTNDNPYYFTAYNASSVAEAAGNIEHNSSEI